MPELPKTGFCRDEAHTSAVHKALNGCENLKLY